MKKILFLAPLLLGYAAAASTFPFFPAYDPFVNASGSGGSTYAASSLLAGQTNATGQYWYGIYTSASSANGITNTGNSLSYLGLPAFSGNSVLLRNVAGEGARMFFQTSGTFPPQGTGSNFYFSVVMVASNITNLATTNLMAFGTQTTIGNQTSDPSQGATLWIKQVVNGTITNFELGLT